MKDTYFTAVGPHSSVQSANEHKFRNTRSESSADSESVLSHADMPASSTHSYTRKHPGNPIDEPHLVRQLENFHITSQSNNLIASVAQNFRTQEALWEKQPHVTINMDDEETEDYIQELVNCAMLFYFNDRPPSYHGFRSWVDCEFNLKRGWAFEQVRNLGRNFFLVKFCRASHRDKAVEEGPWYMGRRPMHSYAWHTGFNLDTEFIEEAPVWIELPLRNQILEPHRRKLIAELGHLIYYQAGQEHTEYPNDRACILWTLRRQVPKKIKLVYRNTILWQDISFKTMPSSCTICRSTAHLAYECTQRQTRPSVSNIDQPNPIPASKVIPTPTQDKTENPQNSSSSTACESPNRADKDCQIPVVHKDNHPLMNPSHQSNLSMPRPSPRQEPQSMDHELYPDTVQIPYLNLNDQPVIPIVVEKPRETMLSHNSSTLLPDQQKTPILPETTTHNRNIADAITELNRTKTLDVSDLLDHRSL
jgi:hypothetical protein